MDILFDLVGCVFPLKLVVENIVTILIIKLSIIESNYYATSNNYATSYFFYQYLLIAGFLYYVKSKIQSISVKLLLHNVNSVS